MESRHEGTRRLMEKTISQYLNARAQNDSLWLQQSYDDLKWAVAEYQAKTNIGDFSIKFRQYELWDTLQCRQKTKLDSAYGQLIDNKDKLTDSAYISDLYGLQQIYKILGDSFNIASIELRIGEYYTGLESIDSAEFHFSECAKICRDLEYHPLLGDCMLHQARLCQVIEADYDCSFKSYLAAIEAFCKVGMTGRVAGAEIGLGFCCQQLYQTESSIRYFNSALDKYSQLNDLKNIALCKYYLAEAYFDKSILDRNQYFLDSALAFAEESLRLRLKATAKNADRSSDVGYSESCLGFILQNKGLYSQTRERYSNAEEIFRNAGDSLGLQKNLIRLGSLHLEREYYDSAYAIFRNVLNATKRHEETVSSIYGISLCLYHLDRKFEAVEYLKRSISLIESSRKKLPVPELKTGLLSDKLGLYNLLTNIMLEDYSRTENSNILDSAFLYLEKSKAAALTEMLVSSESPELKNKIEQIAEKISQLQKSLIIGTSNSESVISSLTALNDSLNIARLNATDADVELPHSPVRNINSIDNVQKSLMGECDLLLDYMISELGSYMIIIGRDFRVAHKIYLPYDSLNSALNAYYDIISQPPLDNKNEELTRIGKYLYKYLIPNEILEKKNLRNLIIVPSGFLCQLPMEALVNEKGNFLIEDYSVSYIPSIDVGMIINKRHKKPNSSGNIDIFACSSFVDYDISDSSLIINVPDHIASINRLRSTPLLYAAEEAHGIQKIFGEKNAVIYSNGNAIEKNIKSLNFETTSIIHLASHGYIDLYNPNWSAIIFATANDTQNDGLLQPEEIRELPLSTDLVFLSACQTGMGKSFPGEGVLNLARPFIIAGSRSVIVTHWNINDRCSAGFVKSFYESLRKTHAISESLALAKRQMLRSERQLYRHPYYWAGFALIGF